MFIHFYFCLMSTLGYLCRHCYKPIYKGAMFLLFILAFLFAPFFFELKPLAAPCWLPQTGFTVESASRVIVSSPLLASHLEFFESSKICKVREPACPSFFSPDERASLFIPLQSLINECTKPSSVSMAILFSLFIPLIEANITDSII